MAREATARHLNVGSVALLGVAGSAGFFCGGTGMRLMTARAHLVAFGSRLLLGLVTGLTAGRLRSRVRLVTLGAGGVPGEDLRAFCGVTAITIGL
jgi:hypothetical protein